MPFDQAIEFAIHFDIGYSLYLVILSQVLFWDSKSHVIQVKAST